MTAPKIEQRHRDEAEMWLGAPVFGRRGYEIEVYALAAKFAEIEHNARQAERQSIRMENDAVRGAGPLNDLLVARRNARQEERDAALRERDEAEAALLKLWNDIDPINRHYADTRVKTIVERVRSRKRGQT